MAPFMIEDGRDLAWIPALEGLALGTAGGRTTLAAHLAFRILATSLVDEAPGASGIDGAIAWIEEGLAQERRRLNKCVAIRLDLLRTVLPLQPGVVREPATGHLCQLIQLIGGSPGGRRVPRRVTEGDAASVVAVGPPEVDVTGGVFRDGSATIGDPDVGAPEGGRRRPGEVEEAGAVRER